MPLFNIKKIKTTVQEAVDNVSTTVKDGSIQSALENATTAVKDGAHNAVESARAAVKDSGVSERMTGLARTITAGNRNDVQLEPTEMSLAAEDALRIYYYLMSADGRVQDDEIDEFHTICKEFCLQGDEQEPLVSNLISECQEMLDDSYSAVSPLIPAMNCVDSVLFTPSSIPEDGISVSPKLLLWNLFAIAYSDDGCTDTERELIRHIAKKLDVQEALMLEMESAALTLIDLDREEAWVKTTDQPYLTIEGVVREIKRRRAAVLDGVKDLISL